MKIPARQRPSGIAMEMVGQSLALGVIEWKKGSARLGYTDKSIEQIIEMCHGALTYDQVRAAFRALEQRPLFKTIRKQTRGIKGMPGRAPRRVMHLYDPCDWLDQGGFKHTMNETESSWDGDAFRVGFKPNERGSYHTPLKQSSYTTSYTYAKSTNNRSRKMSAYERATEEEEPF